MKEIVKKLFNDLELKNYQEFLLYIARASKQGNELEISSRINLGKHTDCVYFILENFYLKKIGKVGGGSRCMRKRLLDYRSTDATGLKINESIKNNNRIDIIALSFPSQISEVCGIEVDSNLKGAGLEKKLIPKAKKLGYGLEWNRNNG